MQNPLFNERTIGLRLNKWLRNEEDPINSILSAIFIFNPLSRLYYVLYFFVLIISKNKIEVAFVAT